MDRPILYSGTRNASSWAMRAWLALREAGVDFCEEVVDIRRPQRFANLERIGRFSPSATVPALRIGETVVFDSLAIMEFANESMGGLLLPNDPYARAEARSIVAWQHAGLSGICARISFESAFYPLRRALTEEEVAESRGLLAPLERYLDSHGGPYLFGALTLADIALVPAMVRLTRHELDLASFPRCAAWAGALLARAFVREWLDEADTLPHVWYDDYLLPAEPHASDVRKRQQGPPVWRDPGIGLQPCSASNGNERA